MCAEDRSAPTIFSVRINDTRSLEISRFYSEAVNHRLKHFTTNQIIDKYEAAIFCYMQPATIISREYADNLVDKLCEVADVYIEKTSIDVFDESVDTYVCHSHRVNWTQNPQAYQTGIAFEVEFHLFTQKSARNDSLNNQDSDNSG